MKLEDIFQYSQELLRISDFNKLYTRIMELLTQFLDAKAGSIILKSENDKKLYFYFASGTKASTLKKLKIPSGKGVAGWVMDKQKSIIVENPQENPLFYDNIDKKTGFHTKNIIAVPLIGHKNILGVLEILNKNEGAFTQKGLHFSEFFAKFISTIIENLRYRKNLEDENTTLKNQFAARYNFGNIVFASEKMRAIIELSKKAAQTKSSVLIQGESGTGKELFAHSMHNFSPRKNKPFIAINCAAIPEALLESELFGHEKGAFTGADFKKIGKFELANEGTIFLDEISEMPLNLQAKLLRVLQEGEFQRIGGNETIHVDVRIITATNRDVHDMIKSGKFREDLFYRINVFPIIIPPLRDRKEDIEPLFKYFIERYTGKSFKISKTLIGKLNRWMWPGNVRELENFAKRYAILGEQDIVHNFKNDIIAKLPSNKILHDAVREFKKDYIKSVLIKYNSNQTRAAEALGLERTYLNRLIKELDI